MDQYAKNHFMKPGELPHGDMCGCGKCLHTEITRLRADLAASQAECERLRADADRFALATSDRDPLPEYKGDLSSFESFDSSMDYTRRALIAKGVRHRRSHRREGERMTSDQKESMLREWQTRMAACEESVSVLVELTGASPESQLIDSIYSVMDLATRQASDLIGCADEWLTAWWLEHQFGEVPMKAGLSGQPLREIKTIEELAALIFDDEAIAGKGLE